MNERQKRLNEVYEYLRKFYGIHTQSDFANTLRKSRNSITLALNGDGKYLTDKLFKTICEAYKGVFDLEYLLTGKGSLLTIEEEVHNEDHERLYNPQQIDNSSLVNAIIAAKDETIASLQRELDSKNETITLLRLRIADLERQLAAANMSDIITYPTGVIDDRPNV